MKPSPSPATSWAICGTRTSARRQSTESSSWPPRRPPSWPKAGGRPEANDPSRDRDARGLQPLEAALGADDDGVHRPDRLPHDRAAHALLRQGDGGEAVDDRRPRRLLLARPAPERSLLLAFFGPLH